MKKPIAGVLLLFVFALLGNGCVATGKKQDAWQPIEPERTFLVHTVQWTEETLTLIAEWYTGDSGNAPLLADANPNIDPERLSAGSEIFISEDLLKTREPMPMTFIEASQPKPEAETPPLKSVSAPPKKTPPPAKPPAPKKEEEFEIVGPK